MKTEVKKRKMDSTLTGLIEIFITSKKIEGKSVQTLTWYRNRLKTFVAYLGDKATLKDLNLGVTREFVDYLQSRNSRYDHHPMTPQQQGGLSPATIHGYVRLLKVFSHWLQDEGFLPVDVLAKLKHPKVPQTMIEVLSDQEIACIFEDINPNNTKGARMFTIYIALPRFVDS